MLEWLTPTEKKRHLDNLRTQKKAREVDVPFYPYLDKINAYRFVCTTQCCDGKRQKNKKGYISLRFNARAAKLFKKHAIFEIYSLKAVPDIYEQYERFGKKARQRTVIWYEHAEWEAVIEAIIKKLRLIKRRMKQQNRRVA